MKKKIMGALLVIGVIGGIYAYNKGFFFNTGGSSNNSFDGSAGDLGGSGSYGGSSMNRRNTKDSSSEPPIFDNQVLVTNNTGEEILKSSDFQKMIFAPVGVEAEDRFIKDPRGNGILDRYAGQSISEQEANIRFSKAKKYGSYFMPPPVNYGVKNKNVSSQEVNRQEGIITKRSSHRTNKKVSENYFFKKADLLTGHSVWKGKTKNQSIKNNPYVDVWRGVA